MLDDEELARWQAAGLYDPDAEDAARMRSVIEVFVDQDVDPADYVGADRQYLVRDVNERMMRPGTRLTVDEAVARSGLDRSTFDDVCAAADFPIVDGYLTEADADALGVFAAASQLFSHDELMAFTRVMASSLGNIADAATALFRIDVASVIEASGGAEAEYARTNAIASDLVGAIQLPMQSFFLNQLSGAIRRSDEARVLAGEGQDMSLTTLHLAVGFVDLVGYTAFSQKLTPAELSAFVNEFEAQAFRIVSGHGGRLVKLIGDEVMFVAVEPAAAFAIAVELVDEFTRDDAAPRGGVAYGPLVSRGGDYYGPVVNMASRIGDLAVPGEILTPVSTTEVVGELAFVPAGRRMLKGFSEPVALASLANESSQ